MSARPASLDQLTRLGTGSLAHYREREHPPRTPLEWLGIAVGGLPELMARARTADGVHGRSRTQSVDIRVPLLDALTESLGEAAATIAAARDSLVARYPDWVDEDGGAEAYAELLESAHRTAPRRAEMMTSGYASFLSGAIEAAAGLAEAELSAARERRWDRDDHERIARQRATQLHSALTNALGGLLAYARLVADDRTHLTD